MRGLWVTAMLKKGVFWALHTRHLQNGTAPPPPPPPEFRAKSQTWPIVTLFLTLTKNLIFKDLYVLTRTGSTINQKLVDSMLKPFKSEIFHFLVTNVTLEWAYWLTPRRLSVVHFNTGLFCSIQILYEKPVKCYFLLFVSTSLSAIRFFILSLRSCSCHTEN